MQRGSVIMRTWAYYNDVDPYICAWVRNLIAAGHIANGIVDERPIQEVKSDELREFTQVHMFCGIGGWSYALRLAGWPDDRPVWTGSCPCQPFSLAGKQRGFADERHLWPVWRELIKERRPAKVFGEQVASAADWLRLVRGDLEALGYAVGAMPVQAASAGADHLRDRYWFVADADDAGSQGRVILSKCAGQRSARPDGVADAESRENRRVLKPRLSTDPAASGDSRHEWVIGADGKSRRVKPGIRLLVDGPAANLDRLRAIENRIVTEMTDYATRAGADTTKVLRILRQALSEAAYAERQVGGSRRISSSAVLLNLLHCINAARDGAAVRRSVPQALTENHLRVVRGVWPDQELVGASCERRPDEQRAEQFTDLVPALSQLLARHVEAHREAARVAHASANRISLLRAFGNAIDPRPAAAFIQAASEVAP